jgi:hypothetical protein
MTRKDGENYILRRFTVPLHQILEKRSKSRTMKLAGYVAYIDKLGKYEQFYSENLK